MKTNDPKYILSVHGKPNAEYWTIRLPHTNAYMKVNGKWDYDVCACYYAARFQTKDAASAFAQYHTDCTCSLCGDDKLFGDSCPNGCVP